MKKDFQALTKYFHAWLFHLKIILCALRPMCVQRYACDKLLDKNGRAEKCRRICSERRDAFTDEQVEKGDLKAVKLGHISLFSFFSTPLTGGIYKKRGVEICAGGAGLLILPRKHPSPTRQPALPSKRNRKGDTGTEGAEYVPEKGYMLHPSVSAHGAARQAALLIIYMTPHRQHLTPQHI